MQKIIRERYENGQLVAREIETSGVRWGKAAKLVIHGVIALSLAVLAAMAVHDGLLIRGEIAAEAANAMEYGCPADGTSRDAT